MVTSPDVLVAMNEPSLRKFAATVRPGGWILYNGESLPADCLGKNIHALADELGDARAANMIMLGSFAEIVRNLPEACIDVALHGLVKSARWLEMDRRAMQKGRELFREQSVLTTA